MEINIVYSIIEIIELTKRIKVPDSFQNKYISNIKKERITHRRNLIFFCFQSILFNRKKKKKRKKHSIRVYTNCDKSFVLLHIDISIRRATRYSNNPITYKLINSVIRERDLSFMKKKKKYLRVYISHQSYSTYIKLSIIV